MERLRALGRHPLAGPSVRYGLAGATVAAVYLGLPLLMTGPLSAPIQVAIPIAYVCAVTLHFNLQRHFVFRHVTHFALTRRQQIARYLMVGAIQYPTTAVATALLPNALGVSERLVFVATALIISLTFFLILRAYVFHAHERATRSTGESDALEIQLLRRGSPSSAE